MVGYTCFDWVVEYPFRCAVGNTDSQLVAERGPVCSSKSWHGTCILSYRHRHCRASTERAALALRAIGRARWARREDPPEGGATQRFFDVEHHCFVLLLGGRPPALTAPGQLAGQEECGFGPATVVKAEIELRCVAENAGLQAAVCNCGLGAGSPAKGLKGEPRSRRSWG